MDGDFGKMAALDNLTESVVTDEYRVDVLNEEELSFRNSIDFTKTNNWYYETSKRRYKAWLDGHSELIYPNTSTCYLGMRVTFQIRAQAQKKSWGKWRYKSNYTKSLNIVNSDWDYSYRKAAPPGCGSTSGTFTTGLGGGLHFPPFSNFYGVVNNGYIRLNPDTNGGYYQASTNMLYMNKYTLITITCFSLLLSKAYCQPFVLQGIVVDVTNGEPLPEATIYEPKLELGAITNDGGYFSLTVNTQDTITLYCRYVGYKTETVLWTPGVKDSILRIEMQSGNALDIVEVTAPSVSNSLPRGLNLLQLSVKELKTLPAFFGETDALKSFQLLPGIQTGSEGTSGLYVRGGSPDQNLYLMDNMPLYNVNHLGGFLSVFDVNTIKSIQVLKGGFPAKYSGRLSSVIDVKLKEGNQNEAHKQYSIGILSSKLSLEGPLNDGKTTYILSLRRSLIDLFTRLGPLLSSDNSSVGYTLLDGTSKLTHRLSDRDKLFISFYGGYDHFFIRQKEDIEASGLQDPTAIDALNRIRWGNTLGVLRWNRLLSDRFYGNISLAHSRFFYKNLSKGEQRSLEDGIVQQSYDNAFLSNIEDWSLRADFEYFLNNNQIEFGAHLKRQIFRPGITSVFESIFETTGLDTTYQSTRFKAIETMAYADYAWSYGSRWSGNLGVNAVLFIVPSKSLLSIQPRASISYKLSPDIYLNASVGKMTQYLHLLSNTGLGLPTDLWVPATENVPPQQSWQGSLGISGIWKKSYGLEWSVEGYYKKLSNLIAFSEGTSFFAGSADWQEKIEKNGDGKVYGLEFLLRKKSGKTTGWLAYTLAWNYRRFDNLNEGDYYPFRYDRRHDIAMVFMHKFNERVALSANWVFNTGDAITLPSERFTTSTFGLDNNYHVGFFPAETHAYQSRNNFRTPAYHRLDISVSLTKKLKKGERVWVLGLYNAYSNPNPYYLYFDKNENGKLRLYQYSLFPILPSISYNRYL